MILFTTLGHAFVFERGVECRRFDTTPYVEHKAHWDFDGTTLFLGHLQWEIFVARYLLERCMSHFGYA